MKRIFNIISLLALLLGISSCNGFLDVNTDPTRVSEDDVTLAALLPTVIERSFAAQYSSAVSASRATHQLDAIQGGYYTEFQMSGAWSTIYLRVLPNIATVIKKANAEGSIHYVGVAEVLKALNVGLLTDCWENAPYSEALKGSLSVTPAYDSQESLYAEIISLLDQAITDLSAEESFRTPGKDDLIYGGNMEQWIKLAHSLKARYMLHLLKKNNNGADILNEVAAGMESNDDNFMLVYSGLISNPWYSAVAKKIGESIFTYTYGGHLIKTMNGEFHGILDPRLPLIADKDTSANYVGLESYDQDAPGYTVLPTENTFYFAPDAPLVVMSYSELKFIQAEVMMAGGGDATAAYMEGITANMDMLGVDPGDRDNYLADPAVSSVNLANIMKEKYIALLLNTEVWNDMRRYNFDSNIFKGFIIPDFEGRDKPGQRARYPESEKTRNKDNFELNVKDFTEPMWKDK